MKITVNAPAARILAAQTVTMLLHIGTLADDVGRAAADVQRAAEATPASRRLFAVSPWAASAWADLLGRFTGR